VLIKNDAPKIKKGCVVINPFYCRNRTLQKQTLHSRFVLLNEALVDTSILTPHE